MAYKPLKLWFDQSLADLLADKIKTIDGAFDKRNFVSNVVIGLDSLELKARVRQFADHLFDSFGQDYEQGAKILSQILGPENKEETGMFNNFYWLMPISAFVEFYGTEHFDLSIKLIEEITKRNTGEYCIRPFIERYTEKTLEKMISWSESGNFHVRRLSSEGLRPRLPWARKLDIFITDPTPILPVLENLKDDSFRYVQKSVANCINDILKDNEAIGKELLLAWKPDASKSRMWIIQHATRNLRKANDPWLFNSGLFSRK